MVVVLELVPCISNYQIRTLWEQKFFTMSKNAHFVSKLPLKESEFASQID